MSAGSVRAAVSPRRFFSELLARPAEGEDDDLDAGDDSPYCACNLEPTIEELDTGVCDCCGKPLS